MGNSKTGNKGEKKTTWIDSIKREAAKQEKAARKDSVSATQYTELVRMNLASEPASKIAEVTGMSLSLIQKTTSEIRKIMSNYSPEHLQAYKDHNIDLYKATEAKLLQYLTCNSKLEKAPLNQVAYAMETIHKIRRLEEGKSTDNSLVVHTISGDKYK